MIRCFESAEKQAHLTASRYKAKNCYVGLFQFSHNVDFVNVFLGFGFVVGQSGLTRFDNSVFYESVNPVLIRDLDFWTRHFYRLVTAVTTAPFVSGHDGFVFDSLLLSIYYKLVQKIEVAPFNRVALAAFVTEPGLYPEQQLFWGFRAF